jgi:hypothetical protein
LRSYAQVTDASDRRVRYHATEASGNAGSPTPNVGMDGWVPAATQHDDAERQLGVVRLGQRLAGARRQHADGDDIDRHRMPVMALERQPARAPNITIALSENDVR